MLQTNIYRHTDTQAKSYRLNISRKTATQIIVDPKYTYMPLQNGHESRTNDTLKNNIIGCSQSVFSKETQFMFRIITKDIRRYIKCVKGSSAFLPVTENQIL